MREIEDAAAQLVAHPVRPPTPVTVLARRVRARRRSLGAAVSAVVVLAGGVSAGLAVAASEGSRLEQVSTGPAPGASTPAGGGVTPPGFVRVDYGQASIAVPYGWKVLSGSESLCPSINDVVLLGRAQTGGGCPPNPAGGPSRSYARLAPLSAQAASGAGVEINGHSGIQLPASVSTAGDEIAFPGLGVILSVNGPQATTIVTSIGWSQQYFVLHPVGPVSVPASWHTITYAGLEVRVPPTWPVRHLGRQDTDPGICGPAEFRTPQVYEGEGGVFPSCPPSVPTVMAGVDGLWIRGYQSTTPLTPPAGALSIGQAGGRVLTIPDSSSVYVQPVLRVLARPSAGAAFVSIDIGLGSDPLTASRVLASLSTGSHKLIPPEPTTVARRPAPTTKSATTTPTIASTRASLDSFLGAEAIADAIAARQAGQPWNGYLHSPPVSDQGQIIAVAAFSYDPSGQPVQVLRYRDGTGVPTPGWARPKEVPRTPPG